MINPFLWFCCLASLSILCLAVGFANATTINNRTLDTLAMGLFWGINLTMLVTLGVLLT